MRGTSKPNNSAQHSQPLSTRNTQEMKKWPLPFKPEIFKEHDYVQHGNDPRHILGNSGMLSNGQ